MRDAESDARPHEQGGFLARWSERKQAVRHGVPVPGEPQIHPGPNHSLDPRNPQRDDDPPAGSDACAGETGEGTPVEAESPAVLTDADMPPLETLDGHSDYSGFMSSGVSPELRRRALAQLFRSPHLNVSDGLNDYDGDFTGYRPLGDLVTADMRRRLARAVERLSEGTARGARDDPRGPDTAVTAGVACESAPSAGAAAPPEDGSPQTPPAEPHATDAASRGSA